MYDCNPAKLSVTCPDFSDEMNLELDRLASENSEGRRALVNNSRGVSLKVALDGPLSSDEYSDWCQSRYHTKACIFWRSAKGIRRYMLKP
jgi:hypothetical protein